MSDIGLPSDVEAERQVLGAVLCTYGKALNDIRLEPERFQSAQHQVIAECLLEMAALGQSIDPVTATDHLIRTSAGRPDSQIGPYLNALFGNCHIPASVKRYWEIVTDCWVRRSVVEAGTRLSHQACDMEIPREQSIERARSAVDKLAESVHPGTEAESLADLVPGFLASLEEPADFPSTGWPDIDHVIGGWRPGCTYVVAARPGSGKSLFALNTAMHVAKQRRVLFHSLEMSQNEIVARAISAQTGIHHSRLVRQSAHPVRLSSDELRGVRSARDEFATWQLVVDPQPEISVAAIHSRSRTEMRKGPLGLVIIDYLQLVNAPQRGRMQNREQEVALISRSLKLLAKDLHVPVLVVAQLNRGPEQRADGRPRMSDLRESGAVEQDADVIMLLTRDPDDEKARGEVDVIIDKNRHGERRTVSLAWQAHRSLLGTLGAEWGSAA